MKKKVFAAAIVAALILTACSPSVQDGVVSSDKISDNSEKDDHEDASEKDADALKVFDKSQKIEETVLMDENNVKITATELTYSDYAAQLHLLIENNSSKEYSFVSGAIGYSCNAINGYMVADGYLNIDVPAGSKAEDTVEFSISELRLYGINQIADMQIGFMIRDEEYNDFYSGPRGVRTGAAEKYDYGKDTYLEAIKNNVVRAVYDYEIEYLSEDVLYDSGGMKVNAAVLVTNTEGEKVLLLEVQNNSEDLVSAVIKNVMINEEVNYEYLWSGTLVNPGAKAVIDISADSVLSAADIEEGTVTEISSIAFTFSGNFEDGSPKTAPEEIKISF